MTFDEWDKSHNSYQPSTRTKWKIILIPNIYNLSKRRSGEEPEEIFEITNEFLNNCNFYTFIVVQMQYDRGVIFKVIGK